MERNYKYKAFISYSHRDWKWAKWLHRGLESYRTPEYLVGSETSAGRIPARLTPVFRDRDELPSASNLSEHIKEALRDSENLILICSRDAARSRWVNQEIETFKRQGRSDRIFSLIVDGDPVAEGTDQDCFPPALRTRYDASGDHRPGTVEPIAADSRKHRDGRSLARLKIIAGLLGVGLDDLRQRELQRRHRRLAVVTATSLAALAVTMILAINAYVARNDANQRREQAEDLLGFMVVDLRESLTPIGRLDLLEEVGERAMAYFATVDVGNLTDEELLRQAQVMTQLGEIRMDQRQYDDALTSFMQAYDRSAELYRNDRPDGDHLFARGQAEFWVGYVHWRRGDVDNARDWLTHYLVSSQELTDLDRNRDDWAIEVAYGYHNLAVLAWESDDLEAADEGFNRELDTLVEMQARDTSRDLKRDIADVVSWLGAVSLGRGQLSDALEYYERSAAELRSLSLEEPNDAERQYDWAAAALWIVEVSSITGDIDRADELIDQAILVFDDLVARDDANKEWLRSSLRARISKGYLLAAHGVWDFARENTTKSTALLKELIAEEASDLAAREQLVDAYRLIAWIGHATGEFASALESSEEALSNMQVVEQAGRLNDDRLGKLASIYVVRGQLQAASEQHEQAQQSWQHAAQLLSDRASTARSPHLLDPWVRVLMLLGRDEEAEATYDELIARRYKPLRPWPELPD